LLPEHTGFAEAAIVTLAGKLRAKVEVKVFVKVVVLTNPLIIPVL
jgi:hypothetical protein